MTECGQLVILEKQTLEKANMHQPINKTKFSDIKDLDVSTYHPLGKQFGQQKILTLDALLKILEPLNVVVILYANRTSAIFIEKFKRAISTHDPMFTKKIIFCCRSPIIVYKVWVKKFFFENCLKLECLPAKKNFPQFNVRNMDGQSECVEGEQANIQSANNLSSYQRCHFPQSHRAYNRHQLSVRAQGWVQYVSFKIH